MSVYGLPRRLIHAVLGMGVLTFLLGDAQLGLGSNVWRWGLGAFSASVFDPVHLGRVSDAVAAKTPPGLQGRVFAADNMLRTLMPL